MKLEFDVVFVGKVLNFDGSFVDVCEFETLAEMINYFVEQYGLRIISIRSTEQQCVYSLQQVCYIYTITLNELKD